MKFNLKKWLLYLFNIKEHPVDRAVSDILEKSRYTKKGPSRLASMPFEIEECTSAQERLIYAKVFELKRLQEMSELEAMKRYGVDKRIRISQLRDGINRLQIDFDKRYGHGIRRV